MTSQDERRVQRLEERISEVRVFYEKAPPLTIEASSFKEGKLEGLEEALRILRPSKEEAT